MKKFDLKKEEFRGSIKQLMTVRGLRMINLSNYNALTGNVDKKLANIHSIKIDIMTDFVTLYANGNGNHAGIKLDDINADVYKNFYNRVLEIFKHEGYILGDLKRNILVRVSL